MPPIPRKDIVWLLAAGLIVVFQGIDLLSTRMPRFRGNGVPVSRVHPNLEVQWRFLNEAALAVPSGASYTIISRDPDTEMSLYMMSLGILLDRRPRAASYFNVPTPIGGRDARFVLAFAGARPAGEPMRVVRNTPWGQVYERIP